ncbi:MAG: MoaD/ThiS family protein [Candidatus Heimdallarchaeota archaeon]
MKVTFTFKGSIFNQSEDIILDLKDKMTIIQALKLLTKNHPKLLPLILKDENIRSDILIIVDKMDVISMNLLEMPLTENQVVAILPLAHGG